ncbi:MAG: hypothetical protein AAB518_02640 [Patescibacteria group bacterium]|mgnify:CR=1 FL=1
MNVITSPQKIKKELRALVTKAVFEVLHDPDFGRELSESARKRLRSIKVFKGSTKPLADIKKRYL